MAPAARDSCSAGLGAGGFEFDVPSYDMEARGSGREEKLMLRNTKGGTRNDCITAT